jgi:RNA polymerase sigma-70 factor (ECF subfamily)
MERAASTATASTDRLDFDEVFHDHSQRIWNYILKLTKDSHAADDLSQEVFLRAFKMLKTLQFREKVKSWLFSIGYHVVVDWMRKSSMERRLRRALEREGRPDALWCSPERMVLRSEEIGQVQEIVQVLWLEAEKLPAIYREVLNLRYRQGCTLSEIASQTNIPIGNVKVRLHRARKQLVSALEKKGALSSDAL